MKNLIWIVAILALVSCQQEKIGFVDTVKLMEDYQEKVDIDNKYKSKAEVFAKRRDSISQAFQLEAMDFQKRAERMSQQKAQEEYQAFQQKSQIIGQQLQQEEAGIQAAGQNEMDSLVTKVKEKIKEYGKSNGYSYIFTSGDGGAILYGTETNDLTDALIKSLNDEYKK